jgi:tocopherol cyclase
MKAAAAAASLPASSAATTRKRAGVVVVAAAASSSSSLPPSRQRQVAADAAARTFQPPPHSGYHYDGSSRRFFEGWYFKVDLPRLEDDGASAAGGRAAAAERGGGGSTAPAPPSSPSTDSIALIYSVEDPGDASSGVRGVGVQLMGPGDGYLCQFARDTRLFWADERRLALGACLRSSASPSSAAAAPRSMVAPEAFDAVVREGFQASTTWHQGRIVADERGAAGAPMSTVRSAEWCFSVRPVQGWGGGGGGGGNGGNGGGNGSGNGGASSCASASPFNRIINNTPAAGRPLATAGWLSALSVFEPHWQVLVADGLATGWVRWGDGGEGEGGNGSSDGDGGRVRHFVDAPFYAEKNWGGGFPSKWMWIQCNNFRGARGVSVTAVGARRALLVPGAGGTATVAPGAGNNAAPTNPLGAILGGLLGGEEDVGMIGVHLPPEIASKQGLPAFLELVPWRGDVEWSASPWGRWWVRARDAQHEAVLEAECDPGAGTVLRAPTMAKGLAPFCRDTFAGRVRLRVWRRRQQQGVGGGASSSSSPSPPPLVDVYSDNGALEVGGGPWVGEWSARAAMREPFRSLVQLPIDVGAVRDALPRGLQPPGL